MDLSVIIAHHNEPWSDMEEAIDSIKSTIDVSNYEIIIVDDFSNRPFKTKQDGVKVVRQKQHRGVGQAFDLGVSHAQSENIFLQGNDIRYLPNNWASKMIDYVNQKPRAYICGRCVGINRESPDGMNIEQRMNRSLRNGSNILIFHDHKTHPKKPANFRNILECQWAPRTTQKSGLMEIVAVLGAAYIVKKEWYEYTGGFELHRSWGTLEVLNSLKSWLFGGSCQCALDVPIAHIFKSHGTHATPNHHLIYNKLLVATLLFDDYDRDRLISFLGQNPQVDAGKKMFEEVKGEVMKKRAEYKEKIVVDIRQFCKEWNIDFRDGD